MGPWRGSVVRDPPAVPGVGEVLVSQETFTLFWGGPFSQQHPSPFTIGDVRFGSALAFMMYCKALLFGDTQSAAKILAAGTAKEHKALGRAVKGYDEVRWHLFRQGVVYTGNYAKFTQNPE